MVLWACAPGVALVVVDVDVEVEVDVDVDVDVLVVPLSSEPQPTSAKLSATVAIAAAKTFIYPSPEKMDRHLRRPGSEMTLAQWRVISSTASRHRIALGHGLGCDSASARRGSFRNTTKTVGYAVRDSYEVAKGCHRGVSSDGC